MKRHALQGVLGLLVLASSVAGCGGEEPQAPETWSLELTCATDVSANPAWTTFLARIRSNRGAAPSTPVDVAIESPVVKHNFSVPSGSGVAVVDLEGQELTIGVFSATATAQVSGQTLTATCTPVAGLSAIAASVQGTSTGATAVWASVPEAISYEVQVLDPTGTGTLVTARTTATRADVAFARDPVNPAAVLVTARSFNPDALPSVLPAPRSSHSWTAVTSGRTGGDGSAWQLFGPGDYQGETLTVGFPVLAAGEHIAVLLVNAGGLSSAPASVLISGTQPPVLSNSEDRELRSSAPVSFAYDPPGMGDLLARAAALWELQVHSPAAAAVYPTEGLTGSFCGNVWTSPTTSQARRFPSTVRAVTPHAAFWVADESQGDFDALLAKRPDFWSTLGTAFEKEILPLLAEQYGPVSDIDGDGRVAVLFRDLGWGVGNFEGYGTQDTTPDCTNGGLNHADVVIVSPPAEWYRQYPGVTPDELVDLDYPAALVHELTHDVEFTARLNLGLGFDTWLAEGLAMSSLDALRFAHVERVMLRSYLVEYRTTSLTGWTSLSDSDYGKVDLLFHLIRERSGPAFLRRLIVEPSSGLARFRNATGLTSELALAQLATTAVFSNEPSSPAPRFDLADPRWAPLHEKVGATAVTPLPPGVATTSKLASDGWDALVTGKGAGGPASLKVTSSEPRKPHVVVVRFSGDLPN